MNPKRRGAVASLLLAANAFALSLPADACVGFCHDRHACIPAPCDQYDQGTLDANCELYTNFQCCADLAICLDSPPAAWGCGGNAGTFCTYWENCPAP